MIMQGIHDITNNCVEDIIMTFALHNDLPYIYMYADNWKFFCEYNGNGILGDYIGAAEYHSLFPHQEICKQLLGINLELINESIELIEQRLLANQFLCIYLDVFHCNWSAAYHQTHIQHCFIVKRMEAKKLFICDDPYLSVNPAKISIADMLCYNGRLFTVTKDSKDTTMVNIYKILHYILRDSYAVAPSIRKFANFFREYDLQKEMIENTNIAYCPLLRALVYIMHSRINLGKLFLYLGNKNSLIPYLQLSKNFCQIGEMWRNVKNQTAKTLISKQHSSKTILDMILSISNEEEKLSELIHKKLKTGELFCG
ncbi:hypothetical protein [Fumia xinanensis]|uniref:Butirosin biosynthesis protein H N-terminal domain-containing protein n=1 Tax=Fumia xinanensis TaxID=2763659 RepID=A0A926E2Z8_9FIRM|nr:hypothetical protein [Fumia xinanensis]MBC8560734.1 hypothetical protein [Fumia xinanensis]